MPTPVSLIIKHATILTMDSSRNVLEDGAIAINNDTIIALGKTEVILQSYTSDSIIDARDCIVIPGLINAHSHIPMSYFKGLADDLPLQKWLHEYIWPLEGKLISPGFVYDSALHGAAEMIKNGITLTKDMYFYGNKTAEALTQVGLRGMIGEAILDFALEKNGGISGIGRFAIEQEQEFKANPLINFTISPHAIYSCSTQTLEKCTEVALDNDFLVQTHLSETESEVTECLKLYGKRPVQYLHELGMLQTKLVMAHGIWVNEEEMELLAEHNNAIAICTESNLKLSAGIAPIKNYFKHKVRCCFATDGVASNNNIDLLSEMDFTAKLHKVINEDPTFMPAEQVLSMATIEAAKALHREQELGSLETGKKADITILDCHSVQGQPMHNPYSQVIYALGGRAVRDVIINGAVVLKNHKLIRLDEAELINTAKKYKAIIDKELKQ